MKNEESFNYWFEKERRLFEANEPATFTDSDEWCMKKGWMAACDYKDQEYSNLMDAMTRTSQYNAKLKNENDKLKEFASYVSSDAAMDAIMFSLSKVKDKK